MTEIHKVKDMVFSIKRDLLSTLHETIYIIMRLASKHENINKSGMKHKTLIGKSILKNVGFIKTQLEIKKINVTTPPRLSLIFIYYVVHFKKRTYLFICATQP